MLVRPGSITAIVVNNSEDGIGADEIPREDRVAIVVWVAREFVGID